MRLSRCESTGQVYPRLLEPAVTCNLHVTHLGCIASGISSWSTPLPTNHPIQHVIQRPAVAGGKAEPRSVPRVAAGAAVLHHRGTDGGAAASPRAAGAVPVRTRMTHRDIACLFAAHTRFCFKYSATGSMKRGHAGRNLIEVA